MGYIVDQVTWWHEERHGCREADCEIAIEISAEMMDAELVSTMRRNPHVVYCRRRGCGHNGSMHSRAGCMAEGCECEELTE